MSAHDDVPGPAHGCLACIAACALFWALACCVIVLLAGERWERSAAVGLICAVLFLGLMVAFGADGIERKIVKRPEPPPPTPPPTPPTYADSRYAAPIERTNTGTGLY